jgi:hypothetical protein
VLTFLYLEPLEFVKLFEIIKGILANTIAHWNAEPGTSTTKNSNFSFTVRFITILGKVGPSSFLLLFLYCFILFYIVLYCFILFYIVCKFKNFNYLLFIIYYFLLPNSQTTGTMDSPPAFMLRRNYAPDDSVGALHVANHHVELRARFPASSRVVRTFQIGKAETNFRLTCQIGRVYPAHANYCSRAHSGTWSSLRGVL